MLGAVDHVLRGHVAPFQRRGGAAGEYGQRLGCKLFFCAADGELQVSHDVEGFDGEGPGDHRLLAEEERKIEPVAVRYLLVHVGGDECRALRGNVAKPAHQLGISDVVRGGGFANLTCLRVEYVQCGRTGSEIHVVVREIVRRLAQDVEEFEGPGNRLKCPIDDCISENHVESIQIHSRTVLSQHDQNILVMDLDSQLTENVSGF